MWLEDHFGNGSILQRNERAKLAASFWNNTGAGMVIGGMAGAFFLDKPQGTWTKIDLCLAGFATQSPATCLRMTAWVQRRSGAEEKKMTWDFAILAKRPFASLDLLSGLVTDRAMEAWYHSSIT